MVNSKKFIEKLFLKKFFSDQSNTNLIKSLQLHQLTYNKKLLSSPNMMQ